MKQKKTQAASDDKLLRAHAIKIKKWVETVKELQTEKFTLAIPITRLMRNNIQEETVRPNVEGVNKPRRSIKTYNLLRRPSFTKGTRSIYKLRKPVKSINTQYKSFYEIDNA